MSLEENLDVETVGELPNQLTREPLEEGEISLSIKAHGKQGAMSKATEWVNDLARVGVKSHVEYAGIELPEDQCITEGGAVHEVTLVIEEDLAD